MAEKRNRTVRVAGTEITVTRCGDEGYISLTDMMRANNGDFFISDGLRHRNTVEFLGVWESAKRER